ncbi:MAG TPA: single-stranded DNA-binding protein [Terracidiphilus sp.]|jgi:single-strand DNA-binding protein
MNLNKVFVLGHVTQNLTLRSTPSGQPVATMGVATNRAYTDKSGAKQEVTEFHNVVIWGKLAETSSAYLTKGSLVLVEGRLSTRTYDDKDGVSRRITEIVAENIQFGPKPNAAKEAAAPKQASAATAEPTVVPLDGDEEDSGRAMKPMFPDEDVPASDHPF